MTNEAWDAMEKLATSMTMARQERVRIQEEKLKKIREFNLEHPIDTVEVVVYESETDNPITNHWWQVAKQFATKKK